MQVGTINPRLHILSCITPGRGVVLDRQSHMQERDTLSLRIPDLKKTALDAYRAAP